MRTYANRLMSKLYVPMVIVSTMGCSEYETGYYKGRVNDATQDVVMRRYGLPHDRQEIPDGRMVWTYFNRGSATSSYTGYARRQYCRAYVLTFDKERVLRDWRQEDCGGESRLVTEPPSDRK